MAVSARRGTPLTIEEIRAAALRLIQAGDVETLSMRKLAAELDVNPMSLYHHVANKTELIKEVCLANLDDLDLPGADLPWQDQVRALAHAYRTLARTYPTLWRYILNHPEIIEERQGTLWDILFRILPLAGVAEGERARMTGILYGFVSGILLVETLGHITDDAADESFDAAVDIIIRGIS
jgi:AcrR family transcriptional regulator